MVTSLSVMLPFSAPLPMCSSVAGMCSDVNWLWVKAWSPSQVSVSGKSMASPQNDKA